MKKILAYAKSALPEMKKRKIDAISVSVSGGKEERVAKKEGGVK